ncbi:hypothetical protein [Deinococcus sp. QL22]|uniref:hypothetical protein n=1 Tax=Deinococcus sp. QL22 TaxID=2939437 RepID=UPI002017F35C|nr:hypothetical protein [Deinococcus sp. QL22]UQN08198.1 hypothetical protein M1R55_19145 [Deinococcus sp. QL22]
MKGEDWTTGIEHEAQSVDDPVWAAQARHLARRQRFWVSTGRVALAVVVLEAAVLLLNAVQVQQNLNSMLSRPWFTTEAAWWAYAVSLVGLAYLGAGMLLGLFRLSPRLAVPIALAFPLFELMTSALVPRTGKPFPGSPLETADLNPRVAWADLGPWMSTPWFWVQAVVIGLSVWAGIGLGARRYTTRTLART